MHRVGTDVSILNLKNRQVVEVKLHDKGFSLGGAFCKNLLSPQRNHLVINEEYFM